MTLLLQAAREFSDLGIIRRVAQRFASDVSTPAKAAEVLQHALGPLFRDGYLDVGHYKAVSVTAGRMSPEDFAKHQLTGGYSTSGHNPLAQVVISPGFGSTAWADLQVYPSKQGSGAVVLKALNIKPMRKLSGATPEKAVQAVIAWFTTNASELKDPHYNIPIRY